MDERGTSQPEVLIVGAGPTGLSAAIALGRLGVDVCVVERREGTSQHPRGHVENGRTMELMRLWGVESRIREQGLPREFLSGVAFMTRIAGLDLGDIMFDSQSEWLMSDDGAGPASLSSTPQDRLEPILLETARQTGAQVRFSTELLDLQNTADGVSATVRGPDGEEILHAAYAIAADGPRSRVRDLLGIPVEGPGVLGAQLGIYFHADLSPWVTDRPRALYWIYNPDVQGVVIALDGRDRWHLLFAYDEQRESVEDYPPERCAAIVRELIGSEEVEVDVRSVLPWRMRAAVAEHFRAGRVFLAGDAAHTMPPTGGMGMNSGIGDVHNLAWKLHAVLRGDAGAELLDTYEPERLPVGRRNTENSVANARTMAETGLAGILVSDPEGFAVIEQPQGAALRERIATAVPGQEEHFSFDGLSFGYCYESDAVVPDGSEDVPSGVGDYHPTARPGARAPHHWLERDGATVSTIDLSDGRWVLLAPGAEWVSAARVVAADLSVSVDAFRVGRDDDADLVDRRGGWAEQYQVGEAGAVLIRPDGHVAWRSASAAQDAADARDTLGAVLAGVLHRSATVALG